MDFPPCSDRNPCKIFFAVMAAMTVLSTFFKYILPIKHLPIIDRYGKLMITRKKEELSFFRRFFEFPKSSMKHFYFIPATVIYPIGLYALTSAFIFDNNPPEFLIKILDFFCGTNRKATVSATYVFVAFILLSIQVFGRFYDTQFVSIFNKKAKLNIFIYVLSMTYYTGVFLIILSAAPKFSESNNLNMKFQISDISFVDLSAAGLFLWAFHHERKVLCILADLRKDNKGNVVSGRYMIPHGDWFEYFSSPHYVAEMLMYIALTVFLARNEGWWYILAIVLLNQSDQNFASHKWYQHQFKQDFPEDRKVFIPYVF